MKFRVVNNTALQGLDYEVLTDTVTLPEGVVSKLLPIRLIDDLLPEQQEVFYVELQNQITGGAVLGTTSYAVVTILPSDDPNGLFGRKGILFCDFILKNYRISISLRHPWSLGPIFCKVPGSGNAIKHQKF